MDDSPRGLPERAVAWVCQVLGGELVEALPMPGGKSAAVHRLRVRTATGVEAEAVLKRFTDTEWLAREPDLAAREALALRALAALDLVAPRALACDAAADDCDVPAVLMSLLPGEPSLPGVADPRWLEGLAAPLAVLHAAGPAAGKGLAPYQPYTSHSGLERLGPPSWSARPDLWQRAFEILRVSAPEFAPTLIHRDYHPCNVLWDDGRLTGITDWTNACLGPGEIDLAHCRLNLVCLYGREVADQFGAACEGSGTVPRHPYWDLRCAADFLPLTEVYRGWVELGRRDLSLDEIRSRVDDWVRTLVADF